MALVTALAITSCKSTPKKETKVEETKAPPQTQQDVIVSSAKAVILKLADAVRAFHTQNGSWPTTADQLERAGLIAIPDSVKVWWQFSFSGDPISSITAISTEKMPYGSERPLVYRPATNKWMGWGAPPNK